MDGRRLGGQQAYLVHSAPTILLVNVKWGELELDGFEVSHTKGQYPLERRRGAGSREKAQGRCWGLSQHRIEASRRNGPTRPLRSRHQNRYLGARETNSNHLSLSIR